MFIIKFVYLNVVEKYVDFVNYGYKIMFFKKSEMMYLGYF